MMTHFHRTVNKISRLTVHLFKVFSQSALPWSHNQDFYVVDAL